jgi:hypothetical protein
MEPEGLPSRLFPSSFQVKILYAFFFSRLFYTSSSFHTWFDRPSNIWWGIQFMKLLIIQVSPDSCYFLPLRQSALTKYYLKFLFTKFYFWTTFAVNETTKQEN